MKSLSSKYSDFIYGGLIYHYELIYQDRKTLNLTVMPDLKIYLKSPLQADEDRIETFLRKKWFWLEKQLMFFGKYQRKMYKREFVSGESFRYLGKQYQLMIKQAGVDKVTLQRGLLLVATARKKAARNQVESLVAKWYEEKTRQIFAERYEEVKKNFAYKQIPKFTIRNMKRRWGSCMSNDKIILNPKLIHVSKDCIDYVITHELCHIKYKGHDKKFVKLLDQKYPKWEKTKEKLEITGAMIQ